HQYLYNLAGQRTNEIRTDGSTVNYAYDRIGQLKIADSSVSTEDRGYTYDAAWNLNYLTNNGFTSVFRVDNKNELTNAFGTLTLAYDQNGNLTNSQVGALTCTYDDENELITIMSPNVWRAEFTYDGRGRRRVTKDFQWNGSSWALTN